MALKKFFFLLALSFALSISGAFANPNQFSLSCSANLVTSLVDCQKDLQSYLDDYNCQATVQNCAPDDDLDDFQTVQDTCQISSSICSAAPADRCPSGSKWVDKEGEWLAGNLGYLSSEWDELTHLSLTSNALNDGYIKSGQDSGDGICVNQAIAPHVVANGILTYSAKSCNGSSCAEQETSQNLPHSTSNPIISGSSALQ